MITFSVVRIHLVHFSVQVTTWWWSESSCGLIGTERLCIGFIDIFASIGHIRLIHLLFIQQSILPPELLSYPPVKLSFGGVLSLGIMDYWHCYQLFLHWRMKILIWFNCQLLWWSVNSRTNIYSEIQVSSFHTISEYIFLHHYHDLLLYFFIIQCFHLAY